MSPLWVKFLFLYFSFYYGIFICTFEFCILTMGCTIGVFCPHEQNFTFQLIIFMFVFNFVCLINFWLNEWQTLLDWLLLKKYPMKVHPSLDGNDKNKQLNNAKVHGYLRLEF